MGANKEAIPVPHVPVVPGRNQVGIADISLSRADGPGSEVGEVGGEASKEGGIWGRCGFGNRCVHERRRAVRIREPRRSMAVH